MGIGDDKTIFSILERPKLSEKDYKCLFYFFFKENTFRCYMVNLAVKILPNFSKNFLMKI